MNIYKVVSPRVLFYSVVAALWAGVSIAPEQAAAIQGTCVCSTDQNVTDDSQCRACSSASQCPNEECTARIIENGEPVIRSFPCRFREEEPCKETCDPDTGWMVVDKCPDKAEKDHCGDYYCNMIKIGYSGPMTATINGRPNRSYKQVKCEKK